MNKNSLLQQPIKPKHIKDIISVVDIIDKFGASSFQSKNVAKAVNIWNAMLKDNTIIFLGLAGAMVPAGMRDVITFLIENRMIDCVVSTGANLFHDVHEILGRHHYQGSHNMVDDETLYQFGIDRIYDVFALEDEFRETDDYIMKWINNKRFKKPISTREFFYLLGESLVEESYVGLEGIITSAYKNNLPIYCPAIGDSSIGISLAVERWKNKRDTVTFDIIKDVIETAKITETANSTGVIYIGGGTPKNFIQQTEVTASIMKGEQAKGHKYAIQIIVDSPHWGGLSGCTFSEAKSWGKIALDAKNVTVYSDATIALPLITASLAEKYHSTIKERKTPVFNLGETLEIILS